MTGETDPIHFVHSLGETRGNIIAEKVLANMATDLCIEGDFTVDDIIGARKHIEAADHEMLATVDENPDLYRIAGWLRDFSPQSYDRTRHFFNLS